MLLNPVKPTWQVLVQDGRMTPEYLEKRLRDHEERSYYPTLEQDPVLYRLGCMVGPTIGVTEPGVERGRSFLSLQYQFWIFTTSYALVARALEWQRAGKDVSTLLDGKMEESHPCGMGQDVSVFLDMYFLTFMAPRNTFYYILYLH